MASLPHSPPGYSPAPGDSKSKRPASSDPAAEPLLGQSSSSFDAPPSGSRPAYARGFGDGLDNELGDAGDDVPEDFKVGVTVSQSSRAIRRAFVRKVYAVLCCQLVATTIIGGVMCNDRVSSYVHQNQWTFWVPLALSLVSLFALWSLRQSHPWNLVLLSAFTVFEAIGIGSVVSLFNEVLVVKALVITAVVFVALTLFTLWSGWDFGGMGTYLFGALLVFFMTGLISIFFPFSRTLDAIYAGVGVLIFCAYVLFDTWMICNRLSPDDWVLGSVQLYLDLINLFLQILRLMSDLQRD